MVEHTEHNVTAQVVFLFSRIDGVHSGFSRLHGQREVVVDKTRLYGGYFTDFVSILVCRQRSDVLFNNRFQRVDIEITHEDEGIIGCIGCALFCNFENAVVVNQVDIFGFQGFPHYVMIVERC